MLGIVATIKVKPGTGPQFEALAKQRKTRAIRLPVAGAFHSDLMRPAERPVLDALAEIDEVAAGHDAHAHPRRSSEHLKVITHRAGEPCLVGARDERELHHPAGTPVREPHVAAARKSSRSPGRLISYVMTTAGPEPIDNVQHPLDREHYVAKQVRPVAEPVLAALGLDFDRVIGDDRQMDLYSVLDQS